MGVGQLSESDAVDALRLPFYSSSHPTGSHGCRNQFDLGNPDYNVPDLKSFLQAVLLMPRSITSDFNFPKWHYYGRGSGQDSEHYEYSVHKTRGRR